VDDADTVLRVRPDSKSHLLLGSLRILQDRHATTESASLQAAIKVLSEAQRLDPQNAQPLYWRGLCRRLMKGQELEAAVSDLQAAARLRPDSPVLLHQLAQARLDLMFRNQDSKDWKEASEEAGRAVAAVGTLTDEDLVAGFYEADQVSRSQAVSLLARDAHLCRAKAFNQGNENQKSADECTAAIRLDEKFWAAYLWRGIAKCAARDHREAQADFRAAVRLSSDEGQRKETDNWLNRCLKHRN
jgi:tetratricopeptide (TPR) repeat protein